MKARAIKKATSALHIASNCCSFYKNSIKIHKEQKRKQREKKKKYYLLFFLEKLTEPEVKVNKMYFSQKQFFNLNKIKLSFA